MKKYLIRRAIVYSLYKFNSPKTLNEIISRGDIITLKNCEAELLRQEWDFLIDAEILIPIQGFIPYCKLSDEIREQLEAGYSLCDNEFLYGPAAIGFIDQEKELKKLLSENGKIKLEMK